MPGGSSAPRRAGRDPQAYARLRTLTRAHAGIELREGKEPLIAARVIRRQRALGLSTVAEYVEYLEADSSGDELIRFLDAIATNVTAFFREPDHFEALSALVAAAVGRGQPRLRLWSAAASSGEEPYSMAITVLAALKGRAADVKILATDLSTAMLERARAGVYPAAALRPAPSAWGARYCEAVDGGERVRVRPAVRALVRFARLNLAAPPFPMQGPLDCIFCRNVTMYLGRPERQRLLAEVERLLAPGGLFLIGHAETLLGLETRLQMVRASVFVKEGGPAGAPARRGRE